MIIKKADTIDSILLLHKRIFGVDFPVKSFFKKKKENQIYIFLYEEAEILIGYSIIVDQYDQRNLYAWYGGVLPDFQGKGITEKFFNYLIDFATKMDYLSITVASTNMRPHMLVLAIKLGFNIVDIKKREPIEKNKIYFKYSICKPYVKIIDLNQIKEENEYTCVEEDIIDAYKKNCMAIKIKMNFEKVLILQYIITYCNGFSRKPKILIEIEKCSEIKFNLRDLTEKYQGIINII